MYKKIGALALLAAAQSFAIFGLGGHYVMNTGSLDASSGTVANLDVSSETANVVLDQKKVDGLGGFGVKLWVDALPFVDVEATGNMMWSRYSASLNFQDQTGAALPGMEPVPIELEFDGLPGLGKAKPVFAAISGDLSVTYPFDMIPFVRPYIGGGISYIASTPVMDSAFTQKFLAGEGGKALLAATTEGASGQMDEAAAQEIGQKLGEALADEGLNTGIGAHAIVGVRVKPPIIPLAIYANSKYYFGGGYDSRFDSGFVFEIGGGFAI